MSTENETKKEDTKELDQKQASMLKALGYLDDINEQAKLPSERDESDAAKTETEEGNDADVAAKAAEDAKGGAANDEKTEEPAEADAAKKEASKTETKTEEKRVRKAKPGDVILSEQKSPSLTEIVDAVKEAVRPLEREEETKVEVKAEDTFRKNLHPAELKALELAEIAAKEMPEKYGQQAEKEVQWIQSHRKFVSDFIKENGKFDPNSQEYVEFVRANRPQIPQHDRDELFLRQAESRAAERIKKEVDKEISSRDRAIAELKFQPVIEKVGEAVKNDVVSVAGPEFAKLLNENPEALVDEFPMEAPIVVTEMANAVAYSKEYMALARGLKPYNDKDQSHRSIVTFIEAQGKNLDTMVDAGKPLTRDGKVLVSRERYYALVDAKKDASKFATFTDTDVVNMMSFAAKQQITSKIEAEKKRIDAIRASQEKKLVKKSEDAGAEKKAAPAQEKTAPPPKGGATISTGVKTGQAQKKAVPTHLKVLGYPESVSGRD